MVDYSGWEDYSRQGMPPQAPPANGWDKFAAGAGKFLNSDALPVVLGQAAQAIMGGDKKGRESWQSGLGRVASGLGQSNIAAKAAKRQGDERSQLAKMLTDFLSGNSVKYTPKGETGPSTSKYETNNQGYKFVLEGDGDALNPSEKNLRGPVQAPQSQPQQPQQQPQQGSTGSQYIDQPGNELYQPNPGTLNAGQQPQQPQQGDQAIQPQASPPKPAGNVRPAAPPTTQQMGSLLPFYLAQTATGSGGSGGNLFGLSPEQIQGISRTDIMGQELLGRGTRDIFANQSSQAYGDYLKQKPALEAYKTQAATAMGAAKLRLQQQRQAAQNAADYATVAKIDKQIGMMDKEFRLKQNRLGLDQRLANLKAKRDAAASRRDYAEVSEIDQDLRLEMNRATRDAEVEIIGGYNSKGQEVDAPGHGDITQSILDNFNSISQSDEYYVISPDEWGPDKPYRKIKLPAGVKAEDMFETQQKNPNLTVDDIIKLLTK